MSVTEQFSNVLAAEAAVAILDRDGLIVEVNDAWRRAAREKGYKGTTFGVGKSYLQHCEHAHAECAPASDIVAVCQGVRHVLSGERAHFTIDHSCTVTGAQRWLRVTVTPRSFSARDGAIVAHADVTREKEVDAELHDAERRLNEIYRIADIGDFEYFALEDRSRLSPPLVRMWGKPEEALGSHAQFVESVHPDDRARVAAQLGDQSQTRADCSYRIVRPDGDVRHIWTTITRERDAQGRVIRFFGLHHDLTNRMIAEEKLDRLFEASIDVLCIISFKGYFRRVNPAFARLLGFTDEEFAAKPCIDFVHPDDRERTMKHVMAQIYENDRERIENRYVAKDGSVVWLSWTMSPAGRDILGVARDVTSERARAEELVRAKDAAEAASRAKSEFLATMSHEIRTPLNGVIGMADLLRTTPLSPEQRERVETIHDSGRVLLAVLNDILDLSRIEAGRLELERRPFSLNRALRSVTELWASAASAKGLSFSCEVAKDVPQTLDGDEVRVCQILGNLLSNAVKFTSKGEVALKIFRLSDGKIACEVRDTGEGIAPDVLPKLFAKFAQGDASVTRRHGGTGLGLAITKQLAELMGGTIAIASTVGAGTTFRVALSLASVASGEALEPVAEAQGAPRDGLSVLVAEDNAVNRKLVGLMLESLGHACVFAEDGEQAVARAKDGGFDVVLMDVQMPVLDGIGAASRIRALGGAVSRIPIIAVTANAMTGDREKYLAAGMDGYVSKPISLVSLAEALKEIQAKGSPAKARASA